MYLRKLFCALLYVGLAASAVSLPAQTNWQIANTWHVGGSGGWDYVAVDSVGHRVFVTRGTHTQVFDGATGKVLADIPGMVRAHGVALAPKQGRGFITDGGGSGAIVVFDLKSYTVLGKLAAVPDADGITYDAALDRVVATTGDGNALLTWSASIDPVNGKIGAPIPLGGSPEFLAADDSGKIFVNLEDKDAVAEVDVTTRKVLARWPVAPGGGPAGMSIDREHHRLFIGCRKPAKMIVMSTDDGKIVASLPIGNGVDATTFDGTQAFASCGDGKVTVVSGQSGSYVVAQVIQTTRGARTMGVDPVARKLYLPAAQYEEPAPGAAPARPKMKPDSFMLMQLQPQK